MILSLGGLLHQISEAKIFLRLRRDLNPGPLDLVTDENLDGVLEV